MPKKLVTRTPEKAAVTTAASPVTATSRTDAPAPTTMRPHGKRIIWVNVLTVVSAAILIGVEVFGAAFAAGWAFAFLFGLGEYGVPVLQGIFFIIGIAVMIRFMMNARRIEPFFSRS